MTDRGQSGSDAEGGWEVKTLGEVARQSKKRTVVVDGEVYPALGVARNGRGPFVREPFIGGITAYKQLTPVSTGQMIMRSITAWESPIGIATEEHAGHFVSQVFPVFDLDQSVVSPSFMSWVCQLPAFWDDMVKRCTGAVLRRMMLSATDLLAIPILVPSLDVQRQIVAVLDSIQDAVTTKRAELDALRTLRQAVMMNELSDQRAKQENWERVPLSKVLTLDRQLTKLVADRVYKQVTVGMRGSGARLRHEILGESIHSPVSTIRAGQLLISKIDARNGALAIVPSTLDGAVVTNNFPHWTVADRQLTLGFLQCLIDIGRLTSLCNESALGTTNRKYTDPDVFMNLTVDLPPLYEQRQIVTTLDAVRHYAQAAEIELAALERLRQAKLQELIPA